ncbi:MAG: fused MFS/spermidine synthase [Opitutales bacterium]
MARLVALVFASGFAGLVYQLLWMRQLSLLLGNTSQAASVTLTAFFAGLAAGNWWWGRRIHRCRNPMRLYAQLEFGIAATALTYFILLALFKVSYSWVYQTIPGDAGLLAVKLGLSLLLVFPPAFFMGGTIPVIGQVAVRKLANFGWKASALYGVNTFGAAMGVAAAAFVMIPSLGFRLSYAVAVAITLCVGVVAWYASRRAGEEAVSPAVTIEEEPMEGGEAIPRAGQFAIGLLCFISGFVVLALEVAWVRIFAQVHENSVYSFAIILIVVLVCLALGAAISSFLARRSPRPLPMLGVLALLGGVFLVVGPSLIMQVTNNLEPVYALDAWSTHIQALFKMGFGGLGLTVIALGTVFPFLMKVAERGVRLPGRTLGWMLGINTMGAILGSLLCGFLFLPWLGMWGTVKAMTILYLIVALFIPMGWGRTGILCRLSGLLALGLCLTWLNPSNLPIIGFPPGKTAGKVLEVWEESDATIVVLERPDGHRAITLNASYSLGSTTAYNEQADQSRIPLHIFPQTETICFIGMGTGISAGAALGEKFPKVKRVVTCELSPAVVAAARKWIPEIMLGGLFSDPRSSIRIEDGRHYLMATDERFDMINADLFLPYRRGTGSLYSLEHYQTVAKRLNPDGVFVQWLPLYQITSDEFAVIARTMLEVFDQVTMWRNNFEPGKEKVALIGQLSTGPISVPPSAGHLEMLRAVEGLQLNQAHPAMVQVEAESVAFFYAGNLSAARKYFANTPINTDNRPLIEYQSPRGFREVAAYDEVVWCVGPKLLAWIERIFRASPLETDPVFEGHPPEILYQVRAGKAFHEAMVSRAIGLLTNAAVEWEAFILYWTLGAR